MLTVVAVVALLLALLALVAAFLALRTLARLRRSVGLLGRVPGARRESAVETTVRYIALTEATRREFDELSVRLLAALQRYEQDTRATVERTADRASVTAQVDGVRAELAQQLDQLKEIVNAELSQIRAGVDDQRAAAIEEIAAERASAATADSAAKEQLIRSAQRVDRVLDKVVETALRRVALVRFDAFDDLSGRLSFALALLDGHGDGIALTALTGRDDTRLYAKSIRAGSADTELLPEEAQAVAAAVRH